MVKIVTLGTGNAFSHAKAFNSAHYIEINDIKLLLDCGPTIIVAAQQADISLLELDYVCISHLHGDHLSGIPFLLLTLKYETAREKPLNIIGPPGLTEQVNHCIQGAYPGLLTTELYNIVEFEFNERFTLSDEIYITPYEAYHISNAFFYTLEHKNLKILYSGDNELQESQLDYLEHGTVLIHELTTMSSVQGGHTSWKMMKNYITRILESVNYVILVHTSKDVREAPQETFPDKVIIARDGNQFEFSEDGKLQTMSL